VACSDSELTSETVKPFKHFGHKKLSKCNFLGNIGCKFPVLNVTEICRVVLRIRYTDCHTGPPRNAFLLWDFRQERVKLRYHGFP